MIRFELTLASLLVSALLSPSAVRAGEWGDNRVSFSGSLVSSDVYMLEGGYHRMFGPYFGIGGAAGHWANYFADGYASGNDWHIDSDYERPENLYLRPSVVLKSPGVNIRSVRMCLYAEPGLMVNIPYQRVCIDNTRDWPLTEYEYTSTSSGQWLAGELRVGLYADWGPCGFSLGYIVNNLDIYSQYRHLSYRGVAFSEFYPEKPLMHGVCASLSYNF